MIGKHKTRDLTLLLPLTNARGLSRIPTKPTRQQSNTYADTSLALKTKDWSSFPITTTVSQPMLMQTLPDYGTKTMPTYAEPPFPAQDLYSAIC
jgi:hypothetical protein